MTATTTTTETKGSIYMYHFQNGKMMMILLSDIATYVCKHYRINSPKFYWSHHRLNYIMGWILYSYTRRWRTCWWHKNKYWRMWKLMYPVQLLLYRTNKWRIHFRKEERLYLLTYYLCLELYNIERSEKSCVTKKLRDGSLRKRFWAIHTFTVEI